MAALLSRTEGGVYWLVMDFEAACEDDKRWAHEIIEWPCVLVDATRLVVVDEAVHLRHRRQLLVSRQRTPPRRWMWRWRWQERTW